MPTGSLGEHKEMYGEVRTLRHVVTGELIDQYEGEWAMEQDYLFYLHSFNWRMNHPNIVNSKFIE